MKGFASAIAAGLAAALFAALLSTSAGLTDHASNSVALARAQGVGLRYSNSPGFYEAALADAVLDSGFKAFGCSPEGDFCSGVQTRAAEYLGNASLFLSDPLANSGQAIHEFSCDEVGVGAQEGFDQSFLVSAALNASTNSSNAFKNGSMGLELWLDYYRVTEPGGEGQEPVDAFGARVRSEEKTFADVTVDCFVPPPP